MDCDFDIIDTVEFAFAHFAMASQYTKRREPHLAWIYDIDGLLPWESVNTITKANKATEYTRGSSFVITWGMGIILPGGTFPCSIHFYLENIMYLMWRQQHIYDIIFGNRDMYNV